MGWGVSGAEWMGAWQFDGVGDFPVQYRPSCSSFFFFFFSASREQKNGADVDAEFHSGQSPAP